jgi:hypothetical protein
MELTGEANFKPKLVRSKYHFTLIKGAIHQEGIIITNTYTLNNGTLHFIKKTLLIIKA